MKIAIIGTRGIPNQYGGFEQFAMFFAEYLAEEGYDITVYNTSNHSYKEKTWKGVKIQHCFDPENIIGTLGQFVYDLFSILDARKKNFDVIFQLGYTSSSVWGFLFSKKAKIITNMDGLEWKRTKYNRYVQMFLRKAESWAVKQSDILIADSQGIQNYIQTKYQVPSVFIPYGADVFSNADESVLEKFNLKINAYNLIIARLEPENNIDLIIKAHLKRKDEKLVIIGSVDNKFGNYLNTKYKNEVIFLGAIYDIEALNNLRFFSKIYFHGHSVGGTNPSLLEAMASSCFIMAQSNEFNKSVLEENAIYFNNEDDIVNLFDKNIEKYKKTFVDNNIKKIETVYSFKTIHKQLKTIIEAI